MPTTLRVGFAMGGGVSLGTFCGSALAQALKLLIVHGRDAGGQPFARLEVDVFSGASAGALSLGAMLRYLLYRTDAQEAAAAGKLQAEFGNLFNQLTPSARADLIAAQVVQDLQQVLWSDEIKLEKLLPREENGPLRFKASLLDRGAVDDIARRHLVHWEGTGIRFDRRRLLADRVLYACTLANLTPMIADARAEYPGREVGFVGLNDGMRSHTHRDIRVFDLNFVRQTAPTDARFPDRWCLYHDGPPRPGLIDDLNGREAWAKIAATAIASGGFPFAFEPVVLARKAFEYGPALWCRTFDLPLPKKKSDFDGQATHLFSFVDGGTFNNEPIREAFRMASFIDGYTRAEDPAAEIQRVIIFVDPFVSETLPAFSVPIQRRWMVEDPNLFGSLDGHDLRRCASLDRLIPQVGTLVGALSSESRVNEGDKIFQVRHRFKLRDGIRASLDASLGNQVARDAFQTLIDFCTQQLARSDSDDVIPPGPLSLAGELERVIQEERPAYDALRGEADAFVKAGHWEQGAKARLWLRLLNFVAVDLILGLEGKLQNAQLVAIAPFRDLKEKKNAAGETVGIGGEKIDLPGGRLSGFAGFMSDLPDKLDYAAARYCAAEFLVACGMIDPNTPLPDVSDLKLTAAEMKQLKAEVEKGLGDLAKRVASMVRQSHLIRVAPGVDGILAALIGNFIRKKIAGLEWQEADRVTVELRVTVPNERFELDGAGVGDQDCAPVEDQAGGPWQLITLATYDWSAHQWSGGFVKNGRLDVDEDGTAFLRDKDFCEIDLPAETQLQSALLLSNPTFTLVLTKNDRGNNPIPPNRWMLEPGISPLEAELR